MEPDLVVTPRKGTRWELTRISDREMYELGERSVPITEDNLFWLMWYGAPKAERPLGLPQLFVALRELFGESSESYDDYKSSFCFPFRMEVRKGRRSGVYLLLVGDYKGGFDVRLYRKRGDKVLAWPRTYRNFAAGEFSRNDYRYLVSFLDGYLGAYLEASRVDVPDFVHSVPNELELYGYMDGKPFARSFEEWDDYEAALARLQRKCERARRAAARSPRRRAAAATTGLRTPRRASKR